MRKSGSEKLTLILTLGVSGMQKNLTLQTGGGLQKKNNP